MPGQRDIRGMPEIGNVPMPRKMNGVDEMVRISDARMSGTAYGTRALHVAPEAYVGGPLAIVETGDVVRIDIVARRLDVELDDDVIAKRLKAWKPPTEPPASG